MVEQVPSKYTPPSITVPGWPDLEAPYPCENEISRHVYVKDKIPVMIVAKLADGTEKRFFLFQNSFGAHWTDKRPATFPKARSAAVTQEGDQRHRDAEGSDKRTYGGG